MFIHPGQDADPVKKIQAVKKQISSVQKSLSMKAMDLMGSKKIADTKMLADCQKAVKELKNKLTQLQQLEKEEDLTMDKVVGTIESVSSMLKDMKQKFSL